MCTLASAFAQQNGQRQFFSPEAFNQRLEEFVKKEAELTDQEGKEFFPLLHQMMDKQREVNNKIQQTLAKGFNAKTEEDYAQIINQSLELEVQSKKIEQVYYKKFHSVLTWKKIHKVRFALSRFNMEALRRFTPNNSQNRQGGFFGIPNTQQNNRNGNNRGGFPQFGQFQQFGFPGQQGGQNSMER